MKDGCHGELFSTIFYKWTYLDPLSSVSFRKLLICFVLMNGITLDFDI